MKQDFPLLMSALVVALLQGCSFGTELLPSSSSASTSTGAATIAPSAPQLQADSVLPTQTTAQALAFRFLSDRPGTVIVAGDCPALPAVTPVVAGANTVELGPLAAGNYQCQLTVTDALGQSSSLTLAPFAVAALSGSSSMSITLGASQSQIDYSIDLAGYALHLTTDSSCLLANISACAGHQRLRLDPSQQQISTALLTRTNASGLYWALSDANDSVVSTGLTQVAEEAPFLARESHQVVAFNDRLWLIGGASQQSPSLVVHNDVWSSSDGIHWVQETAAAAFSARYEHQVVVFGQKLWLVGGQDAGGVKNDVWSSSDGVNWTQATASAGFSARYGHAVAVFNNKLWLTGGSASSSYRNDVWSSADGVSWQQETAAAAFSARDRHKMVVWNNQLWLAAGSGTVMGVGGAIRDVWSSSDGVNWTQATSSAAFPKRLAHQLTVFDDKLFISGGTTHSSALSADTWSSTDGANWSSLLSGGAFSARYYHQMLGFNDRLWLIGGNDGVVKGDVWSSADGVNWQQKHRLTLSF